MRWRAQKKDLLPTPIYFYLLWLLAIVYWECQTLSYLDNFHYKIHKIAAICLTSKSPKACWCVSFKLQPSHFGGFGPNRFSVGNLILFQDVGEILSSLNAAADSLQLALSKATEAVDIAGSINSTVDSVEEILPRQKGRIPRKLEDLILWTGYLILVSYILMQAVLLLCKCLCCQRKSSRNPAEQVKSSLKRPQFLPSSESFLPPLRPRHDEMRPRKKTPECCIFNFCSWQ